MRSIRQIENELHAAEARVAELRAELEREQRIAEGVKLFWELVSLPAER